MSASTITRVAVIGTGVIGASWVTYFLGRGLSVAASDPAPGAEAKLLETVSSQWPAMEKLGLSPEASIKKLKFESRVEAAVADAQFVQENGPEQLEFKRNLFRQIDAAAQEDTILATSSSTIMVSEFQDACAKHPERVVLGHPFNPPHLIPLVEVAGGKLTSPEAAAQALAFYRGIGKHPIHMQKEIRGHIANRLQAALWQEAFYLVSSGVASPAGVDAAIAHGPGLRWALLGPFMNLHLSGGAGGIASLLRSPLWQATENLWRDLGKLDSVDGGLALKVVEGVTGTNTASSGTEMLQERDEILLSLLALKGKATSLP